MDNSKINIYCRILNCFENDSASPETDYKSIYIYHDGNNHRRQVTLARGFTQDGGNLKKVLQRYIDKGGSKSDFFKGYLSKMGSGGLADDKSFIQTLKGCSTESAMREAQDEIFVEAYLNPALTWATNHNFKEYLSIGVIVDSFLQSGTILGWLAAKVSQKTPNNGGDEKKWIEEYLEARLSWFQRSSGPLKNCTYRPKFFLGEIKKGNWGLDCPLVANDSKVC